MGNHPLFLWHRVWISFRTSLKVSGMYEPLLNPSRSICNKADAMQFAIIATMIHNGCGEPSRVNYEEAEKLFNFICEHVEFPVDETKKMTESILSVVEGLLSEKAN